MDFTQDPIYVLMTLCLVILLASYAEKTRLGKQVGSALMVILFTAVLANFKLVPSATHSIALYSAIFEYVAPIGIFYLLLQARLTTIKQAGLPMIGLFLLGSLSTVLGVLMAWWLLSPEQVLGEDAKILAGMLAGTYTGGSANFNAVALAYDFQEKSILYAGATAVDNVLTSLWFLITVMLPLGMQRLWKGKQTQQTPVPSGEKVDMKEQAIDYRSLAWLAFLGIAVFYLSEVLAVFFPNIPAILILTTFAIALAQTKFVAQLQGAHQLGWYLSLLFLCVIGAYCEISALVELKEVGFTLFLFTSLAVFIHGALIIGIGGLLYRDWDMIAIVSQANIGGGTTAIVLAENFKRTELVMPAILVGTLGSAVGTYLGFLVVYVL